MAFTEGQLLPDTGAESPMLPSALPPKPVAPAIHTDQFFAADAISNCMNKGSSRITNDAFVME